MDEFDRVPETEFPGPVVGAVFEGEVDGFSGVGGEVDVEFEPLGLDGFVGDDLVVEDFVVGEDAEFPVAVGVIGTADFEGVFFAGGEVDATGETAGGVFVEGVGLDGFFVAEAGEGADAAFADVFNGETGGNGLDGFVPLGAEGLVGLFVVGGRAADHSSGDGLGEEGDGSLGGEGEGLFGMVDDEGFEGEPEHAGDLGVFDVFFVLGEGVEDGEAVFEGEALDGGGEVESDGG